LDDVLRVRRADHAVDASAASGACLSLLLRICRRKVFVKDLTPELKFSLLNCVSLIDCLGYVACGLVLLTFCMQAIVPLRVAALLSNAAFIAYGWTAHLNPILILHLLLAAINLASLRQHLIARSQARQALRG
jgi:hypothetical protein